MTQPEIPEALVRYFKALDDHHARELARALNGLTMREKLLVKEAAVMGWVQGVRHSDLEYPGDRYVLASVIGACVSSAFRDLYPTISGYQPDSEDAR